jgi:hypothetical protein
MSYIGSPPSSQSFAPGTDTFNGDGTTVAFTLSRNVVTVNDILVVVNNVEQQPSNYTVASNILTFSPAPSAGTNNIYVRYLSTNLTAIVPQQGTVGIPAFSATGTPSATTFLRGDNVWAETGGAAGGTIFVNSQTISSNYTMPAGSSGSSTGPITIASGVTVTLSSGCRWVVL